MTKRDENIQTPERTHDQPAEGGREQADQAEQGQGQQGGAEQSPATGPEGVDSTTEGLEERMPRGVRAPGVTG